MIHVQVTTFGLSALVGPFAVGDLLYADTTGSLARLADVATGSVLVSGGVGTAPAWSNSPALAGLLVGAVTKDATLHVEGATGKGQLLLEGTSVNWVFYETDATANAKYWQWRVAGNRLIARTITDDFVTANEFLRVDRSGATPTIVSFPNGNVGVGELSPDYKLDVNGTFGFTPGSSVTPVDNGDVVFEFTNNTTVTVKGKGSDGTTRSVALTLS